MFADRDLEKSNAQKDVHQFDECPDCHQNTLEHQVSLLGILVFISTWWICGLGLILLRALREDFCQICYTERFTMKAHEKRKSTVFINDISQIEPPVFDRGKLRKRDKRETRKEEKKEEKKDEKKEDKKEEKIVISNPDSPKPISDPKKDENKIDKSKEVKKMKEEKKTDERKSADKGETAKKEKEERVGKEKEEKNKEKEKKNEEKNKEKEKRKDPKVLSSPNKKESPKEKKPAEVVFATY